jgi:hypothetical protein
MKRATSAAALCLAAAAVLTLWLSREPPPAPAPLPAAPPPPAAEPSPAAEPAPAPDADRHSDVSPPPKPKLEPRAPIARPAPALPAVQLDDLLRLPATPAGPQSKEPSLLAPPLADDARPPKQRIRVDFSRGAPLADAPVPKPWSRTEAGVSLPVDAGERVRVRGGVIVDERGADAASRDVETTPSLGLELRF